MTKPERTGNHDRESNGQTKLVTCGSDNALQFLGMTSNRWLPVRTSSPLTRRFYYRSKQTIPDQMRGDFLK